MMSQASGSGFRTLEQQNLIWVFGSGNGRKAGHF